MTLTPPLQGSVNQRVDYVDLAKGFCITIVAFHHTLDFYQVDFPLTPFTFAFWMPLFFFLSGLFFKPYDSFAGFLRRKVNKLIIPFFFFYLLASVLLSNALYWVGYEVRNVDSLGLRSLYAFITPEHFPNGPIWFLLCLFWVNLYFYGIHAVAHRLFSSERAQVVAIVLLSLVCGGLGYVCDACGVDLWAFTDTALTVTPFYCAGYVLRKYTAILQPNRADKWLPLFFVVAVALTFLFEDGIYWQKNDFMGNSLVVMLLGGVTGTLMVMFLSKMIGRLPFVSHWGRYSIIILCTHIMLIQLLVKVMEKVGVAAAIGPWPCILLVLAIVMFSYEVIIPLCIRFIPWFTAQKDLIPERK